MKSLSIIIPAYNEANRIGSTLEDVYEYFQDRGVSYEVIVVDDGSSDNTIQVVKASRLLTEGIARIIENDTNRGKGYSVRSGVLSSEGADVLFTDADLSTPIAEIEALSTALDEGADIAIGSRSVPGARVVQRQPFYRQSMGKLFNALIRFILREPMKDTQCGFKLFRGEVARTLFARSRIDGVAFDAEVMYLARRSGYAISEVGVEWLNSPESKVHPVFSSIQMIRDTIKVRAIHK